MEDVKLDDLGGAALSMRLRQHLTEGVNAS